MIQQRASSPEAYKLLHDGALALATLEANGFCVDMPYLERTIEKVTRRIETLTSKLRKTKLYDSMRRKFHEKTNLTSGEQLAAVLGTPDSKSSTLKALGKKSVNAWCELVQLRKMKNTYLDGLRRAAVKGRDGRWYVHGFYNLHLARSYRSSAEAPNLQNMPIRDPKLGKMIREAIVPRREDRVLIEIDYSGIEVRIAACYHKDPNMLSYIEDKSRDMHRDMAAQCYNVKPEDVTKAMRHCGKNMFVFPQFYGSVYFQCAPNMWEAIEESNLVTGLDHLGIDKLGQCNPKHKPVQGTFEHHLRQVEQDFWGNRFRHYDQWKRKWFNTYQQTGGFETLTGFYIEGVMKRNDVINYPIQGSAFHCLLWAVTQLEKRVKRRKLDALLFGQIHDSNLADVHVDDVDEFLDLAYQTMVVDLMERFPWIIVPIEIEAEVTPPGASWYHKQERTIPCLVT